VVPRLQERYKAEIAETLMTDFQYDNVMQVPKLVKVVINIGLGESIQNAKAIDAAVNDLALISGQKPVVTRAKK
jgi:large subunit ribosomal protein L5